MILDEDQSLPLAKLDPENIIGLTAMHPIRHYSEQHSQISISNDKLTIQSAKETKTAIWIGGFNLFATCTIDLASCSGEGEIGSEFSDAGQRDYFVSI